MSYRLSQEEALLQRTVRQFAEDEIRPLVPELPVERWFRDARVGTIREGTSEIQQQIICRELGMYG